MGDELETREKLLESAMAEFSENGYMKASLRKICADAGVTTGALYFFFKNKNDLFKAIVDEPLKELCRLLTEHYMQDAQDMDSDDPAVLSAEYHIDTHTDLDKLVDYMYLHYDVFMLLLTGAQGSEYENTVDMIVDMTEQGFRISAEKAAARMPNCHVDEYMLHWITHISVDAYSFANSRERCGKGKAPYAQSNGVSNKNMVYNDSRGLENCRLRAVTFRNLHNNVMCEFCISNVDELCRYAHFYIK